jgi:hypothetical protein
MNKAILFLSILTVISGCKVVDGVRVPNLTPQGCGSDFTKPDGSCEASFLSCISDLQPSDQIGVDQALRALDSTTGNYGDCFVVSCQADYVKTSPSDQPFSFPNNAHMKAMVLDQAIPPCAPAKLSCVNPDSGIVAGDRLWIGFQNSPRITHQVIDRKENLEEKILTRIPLWQELDYSFCQNVECADGFTKIVSTYSSEPLITSESCVQNSISCGDISNGSNTQTWNPDTGSYDVCTISCNNGFHQLDGSCAANTQSCEGLGGIGTQTWDGEGFGACIVPRPNCVPPMVLNPMTNTCGDTCMPPFVYSPISQSCTLFFPPPPTPTPTQTPSCLPPLVLNPMTQTCGTTCIPPLTYNPTSGTCTFMMIPPPPVFGI